MECGPTSVRPAVNGGSTAHPIGGPPGLRSCRMPTRCPPRAPRLPNGRRVNQSVEYSHRAWTPPPGGVVDGFWFDRRGRGRLWVGTARAGAAHRADLDQFQQSGPLPESERAAVMERVQRANTLGRAAQGLTVVSAGFGAVALTLKF